MHSIINNEKSDWFYNLKTIKLNEIRMHDMQETQ